jgi:serine phosphatase RsbU (regulator of sigma subunit)
MLPAFPLRTPMTTFNEDDLLHTMIGAGRRSEDVLAVADLGDYLVIVEGADAGKRVEIGEGPMTIGRDARQTIVFPGDSEVSRLHARVLRRDNQILAEDAGSTNGTFVDSERLTGPTVLREGAFVRVGRQLLKYERRSRRDVERTTELNRDLLKASNYVLALLPRPIETGPVRVSWEFVPSAQLGGDAFGYYWLTPETFVFYLMDVSGHGVGAAMHSVAVLNILRQRALPNVDFENPAQVLSSLNDRFQMGTYNGMYFTIWYGVYHTSSRMLTHGSAGHHPAYIVNAMREPAQPVGGSDIIIGALPDQPYQLQTTLIPAGSSLYVFSDGVCEVETKSGEIRTLSDFVPLLAQPPLEGITEPERLYREISEIAATPGELDDDFSLMVLTFE